MIGLIRMQNTLLKNVQNYTMGVNHFIARNYCSCKNKVYVFTAQNTMRLLCFSSYRLQTVFKHFFATVMKLSFVIWHLNINYNAHLIFL